MDDFDKRDQIVNAALDEFSENDFEKASTNNIVKKAKVSKGLLYHYFKSKQELYDYLIDFVFRTIGDGIMNEFDFTESDFFKRIEEIARIKINITKKYPKLYDFGIRMLKSYSFEAIMEMSKKYNLDLLQRIYHENIDFSLFREDVDISKAITIIQWTIEKYGEQLTVKEHMSIDDMMVELNGYLALLKQVFYK